MKKVKLNRECPFCRKDCGETSQNYPFDTFVEHECVSCNAPITNDFEWPEFKWRIRNWYSTKTDENGHSYIKYFKKWGQKVK